eukprot:EST42889.1 hypothetical protein SS50377_17422 [Spironucleus salmonicida]
MNPQLREYNFPTIQTTPLEQVLGTNDPVILDFFKNCLRYSPGLRFTCFQALQHEFFDEVRAKSTDDRLFQFNQTEVDQALTQVGVAGVNKLKNGRV